MEAALKESIQSIKSSFPVSDVYVFGSYARGDERPDATSMCWSFVLRRPEISYYLHERIDLALDVMVTTACEFEKRRSQPWTLEYTAQSEGVAV